MSIKEVAAVKKEDEDCCAHMSYVYGGITLRPKPPNSTPIAIRVIVGTQTLSLGNPAVEDDYLLWQYLAVVRPGLTKVVCAVGDVMATKEAEAKDGEACIVNFCFGRPVDSSHSRGLPKVRPRRREKDRTATKGPTGQSESRAVP